MLACDKLAENNSSCLESDNFKYKKKQRATMNKRELTIDQEPILVKLDKENDKIHDIRVDKNEYTIGRARDCDEIIADILISRRHVILKCDENGDWTITHLSSTVTLLNNSPLEKDIPAKISHGDLLQFSASEEFKFVFTLCAKSGQESKRQRVDDRLMETMLTQQKSFVETQENKRKELEEKLQSKQNEQNELRGQLEKLMKNQEMAEGQTQELNNQIAELQKHIQTGNDAEQQLQQMYGQLLSTLEHERLKFENRLNDERKKWQEALDMSKQEKETVEKSMREQMDKWREQEQAQWAIVMENLVKQEKTEQVRLLNEKSQLEQKLKETEDALKEQAAITEQLQSTVTNERMVLEELPNQTGENCIFVQLMNDGTTDQMEILETIDLTVDSPASSSCKDSAVLNKVGNIMDEQLTCSVCSELFVKAVTLNCMHSFCQHCIRSWMKKKRECPVCRAMIVAINRSIVLDNFIEQMVENLSSQHQARRKELLNERSAAERNVVKIKVKQRKR